MKSLRNKINHLPLLTAAPGGAFQNGIAAARIENGQHPTKHILHERIVSSLLAFRARKGLGASVRDISRTTTLHHRTVRLTLNNLSDLVHEHDGKWYANEPPKDWFQEVASHTVSHWSERFAYTWLFLPRPGAKFSVDHQTRRFSLNHAVVYSYLLSLAHEQRTVRGFTASGLATMTQLDPKTVKSTLVDLVGLDLIEQQDKTIKMMPFEERHLELFAPPRKLKPPAKEQPKSDSRPASNKYEWKKDGYDEHRRLCQKFMVQSYGERAIRAIRFLGWNLTDFHIHLENRKKDSEDNVKSGKCAVENFGKFYVLPLEQRVAAIQKERIRAEAKQHRIEYLDSPEGKKAAEKQKEIIAADPLHPQHILDQDSILRRVQLDADKYQNWRQADKVKRKIHGHSHAYVRTLGLGTQQSVDRTGDLAHTILAHCLAAINDHYQQEVLATPKQLHEAIDAAIRKVEPKMPLMFATEIPVVQHN